jgi:hypothetical protein
MKKIEVSAPLTLPEELEVTEIEMIDDVFTITAHSTRKHPCCPLCGTPAIRFHSSYIRRTFDSFCWALARITARLFQVAQAIGLATGGMLGARLAERENSAPSLSI